MVCIVIASVNILIATIASTTWANVAETTPVETSRFGDAGRVTALQSVIATDLVQMKHLIV